MDVRWVQRWGIVPDYRTGWWPHWHTAPLWQGTVVLGSGAGVVEIFLHTKCRVKMRNRSITLGPMLLLCVKMRNRSIASGPMLLLVVGMVCTGCMPWY